jgi:hypothetical protein
MSALEQTPLPLTPALVDDRRGAPRTRIAQSVKVLVGRGEGVLVDLSLEGARVRHSVQAHRGANLRVSFDWQGERFASTAEVLASRVVALSDGTHPTQYESRLRFRLVIEGAGQLLRRVLASVENDDVRKWVSNLRGWIDPSESNAYISPRTRSYLRCRFVRGRWETKWTHDATQPVDGFVVPETVERSEIASLCKTYERLDDDGRHLVRLLAAETLQ